MALIRQRVASSEYADYASFADDVHGVLSHARALFPPSHPAHELALKLLPFVTRLLAEALDAVPEGMRIPAVPPPAQTSVFKKAVRRTKVSGDVFRGCKTTLMARGKDGFGYSSASSRVVEDLDGVCNSFDTLSFSLPSSLDTAHCTLLIALDAALYTLDIGLLHWTL